MKLCYWEGNNFGDKLNPYIFKKLLPDFFDDDDSEGFFGIGSIIGFEMMNSCPKKIIFSSGFAYNDAPEIDYTYDIFCVRGPLTARILKLDQKYAIGDGALLLSNVYDKKCSKKYKCSFMPHHISEEFFNWREICDIIGLHYISPSGSILKCIDEIQESELIISEAMHGAIVADVLRVPWIPIKIYNHINEFKWQDWMMSLDLDCKINRAKSLYSKASLNKKINSYRLGKRIIHNWKNYIENQCINFQTKFIYPIVIKELLRLSKKEGALSKDVVLEKKKKQLIEKLYEVKEKYKK